MANNRVVHAANQFADRGIAGHIAVFIRVAGFQGIETLLGNVDTFPCVIRSRQIREKFELTRENPRSWLLGEIFCAICDAHRLCIENIHADFIEQCRITIEEALVEDTWFRAAEDQCAQKA